MYLIHEIYSIIEQKTNLTQVIRIIHLLKSVKCPVENRIFPEKSNIKQHTDVAVNGSNYLQFEK